MTLIHTALLSEAQAIIEKYKLSKVSSIPKIYHNENIVVAIGGIGRDCTIDILKYTFDNYQIDKAINIGIAGCSDKNVKIGELFCTNKQLDTIPFMQLITVDKPQKEATEDSCLYDMEGEYFLAISRHYLQEEDIFVLKVVSDHLDDTILSKDQVKKLIQNSLGSFEKWI